LWFWKRGEFVEMVERLRWLSVEMVEMVEGRIRTDHPLNHLNAQPLNPLNYLTLFH
jgi:hypothetical protein